MQNTTNNKLKKYPHFSNKIDVTDDPMLEEFFEERELSDRTKKHYIYYLNMYSNYIGMTIKEFIEEAEDEEEEGIRLRRRKVVTYIRSFNKYVKELEFSPTTIASMMSSIKAFYFHHDIILPQKKNKMSRKARKQLNIESPESIPTMQEIERFLQLCNDLYKPIVIFGVSSGMGQAEIHSLRFEHLFKAWKFEEYPTTLPEIIKHIEKTNETFIPTWNVKRIKTGEML